MSDQLNKVRSALLKVADRLSALQKATPQGSSEASTSTSVVAEQRRLFGHSSSGPNRTTKKGKGPKAKIESTCTMKVVCLSSKSAQSPPSSTINFYNQETADPDIHVPKVDCFVCGEVIRMDELTQHQESHSPTTNGVPAAKKQKTLDSMVCSKNNVITQDSMAIVSSQCSLEPIKPGLQQVKEICPDATDLEIQGALDVSDGNVNDAVGRLLGLSSLPDIIFDDQDDVNDNESDLTPVPGVELDESDRCPETALQFFKTSVIEDAPFKQRISTINFYNKETADPDIHVPKVDCFVCGEVIRMDELTQHQESHSPTTNGVPAAKKQKTLDSMVCSKNNVITQDSMAIVSSQCSLEPIKPGLQQVKEICPDATDLEIQGALDVSDGNVNDAVGRLLGYFPFFYFT
ncbi:hypothetical protein P5673_027030 [Acropora cervicornis]|uniref:Uncharacterized protein n=1 Tax=Acropora cervicornis TaxID=6130 RepID=A0AAD9UW06_ACRCE|nr:hypothetical protein P5673_027030 [Acropora cervicornis]